MDKSNHGIFNIKLELLTNNTQEVADILAFIRFVPTNVRPDYYYDTMSMVGISPLFDSLKEGEVIPTYELIVSLDENQKLVSVVPTRLE